MHKFLCMMFAALRRAREVSILNYHFEEYKTLFTNLLALRVCVPTEVLDIAIAAYTEAETPDLPRRLYPDYEPCLELVRVARAHKLRPALIAPSETIRAIFTNVSPSPLERPRMLTLDRALVRLVHYSDPDSTFVPPSTSLWRYYLEP